MNYQTLRHANLARQDEWDKDGHLKDWSWRCNELAGEAGEVCNILKKLYRERLGLPGSRATKDQLADELADTIICVDLCGMQIDVDPIEDLSPLPSDAYMSNKLTDFGCDLIYHVGQVCGSVSGIDTYSATRDMRSVVNVVRCIAHVEKIDLFMAVTHKFNATSVKVGLKTTLRVEDEMDYGGNVVRY